MCVVCILCVYVCMFVWCGHVLVSFPHVCVCVSTCVCVCVCVCACVFVCAIVSKCHIITVQKKHNIILLYSHTYTITHNYVIMYIAEISQVIDHHNPQLLSSSETSSS